MSSKHFLKILLFSEFLFFFISCQSAKEKSTSLILIRHAEKIISSSDNPDLSAKGRRRAANLVYLFEAIKIDAIYSTPYLRTINTAKPLAKAKQLEIINYQANDLKGFAKKLVQNHKEETIVVIGHSNTTPQLINTLTGSQHPDLSELEYDWVFMLEISPNGTSKISKLKIKM